jgi:hypothetical protein
MFARRRDYEAAVEALTEAENTAESRPRLRAVWRRALLDVNGAWAMDLASRGAWQSAGARARDGLRYAGTTDEDMIASARLHALMAGVATELGDASGAAVERARAVQLLQQAGRPDLASGPMTE